MNMNMTRPDMQGPQGGMPGMPGMGGQQQNNGKRTGGPQGPPVLGPQAERFDPTKQGHFKFKGGDQNGQNDTICKNRYQQISITALGNLTSASSARLLQSSSGSNTTYYSMSLSVESSGFNSDSSSSGSVSSVFYSVAVISMALLSLLL